jgi:hypothetical protein
VRETPGVHVALHADEPLETDQTVVWTQAFQAAWDRLGDVLGARDGVRLGPPAREADWRALGAARLKEGEVARDLLQVVSGPATSATLRAAEALAGRSLPAGMSGEEDDDLVVCAALRAALRYEVPFVLMGEPLRFGSDEVAVRAYGVEESSTGDAIERMRAQVRLHMPEADAQRPVAELCVTVLTGRDGARLVLSGRPPKASLRATWRDAASVLASRPAEELRFIDSLAVPRVRLSVHREYPELVGAPVLDGLPGSRIGWASQGVTLVADERGTEVEAIAMLRDVGAVPRVVVYDRPFLLALLPAGRHEPCALAWIGSTEAFSPWGEDDEPAATATDVAGIWGAWRLDRDASLAAALEVQLPLLEPRERERHARYLKGWYERRRFELSISAVGAAAVDCAREGEPPRDTPAVLRRGERGLVLDVDVATKFESITWRWTVDRAVDRLRLTHRKSSEVLVLGRAR